MLHNSGAKKGKKKKEKKKPSNDKFDHWSYFNAYLFKSVACYFQNSSFCNPTNLTYHLVIPTPLTYQ